MKTESPCELGVGVVYTHRLARVLDLDLVDVLEIEPQMFWHATGDPLDPVRIDKELFARLRGMPQHKLVHSVTLPVGNSQPHDATALRYLQRSIAALDAPYASEHLSFNQFDAGTERRWAGFLLPPKQDHHGVAIAAARLDEMQRAVGVPVAFETGVNYLRPQCGELPDGEFIRRIAETADCGILLDLHNLLANERNGRASVGDVFAEIPRERIWEIHLAGGMHYRGYWLDSHSSHIEDELFAIARDIVDQCPNLRAIIFEIMEEYIDERSDAALRDDVKRMRALWDGRQRSRRGLLFSQASQCEHTASPVLAVEEARSHEQTLGALAIGWVPHAAEPGIVADPAAPLYADLVASMREGVLYETLPFLLRLLLASLGRQATLGLIAAYRAVVPPEQFGAEEAQRFIAYVRARELSVPYLADILDFEEALIAISAQPHERKVSFHCDPAPLFNALREGRNPGLLPDEQFNVLVAPGSIVITRPTPAIAP